MKSDGERERGGVGHGRRRGAAVHRSNCSSRLYLGGEVLFHLLQLAFDLQEAP